MALSLPEGTFSASQMREEFPDMPHTATRTLAALGLIVKVRRENYRRSGAAFWIWKPTKQYRRWKTYYASHRGVAS